MNTSILPPTIISICIYRDEEPVHYPQIVILSISLRAWIQRRIYIFFTLYKDGLWGRQAIDLYRRLATRLFLLLGSDRTGLGPGLLGRPFFETNHLDGRRALFLA